MIELTRVPVTPTGPLADRLTNGAVRRSVVPADDVHAAAAFRPALDDLLDADGLDAVSVRCFDTHSESGAGVGISGRFSPQDTTTPAAPLVGPGRRSDRLSVAVRTGALRTQ